MLHWNIGVFCCKCRDGWIANNFTINNMIKIRFMDSTEITKCIIHCWMCITYMLLGNIIWKTVMLAWWIQLHGIGSTSEKCGHLTQSAVAINSTWKQHLIPESGYFRGIMSCSVCATTTWLHGHRVCAWLRCIHTSVPTSWYLCWRAKGCSV